MRKGIPFFSCETVGKKSKESVESPAEQEVNGSGTRTGFIVNSDFVSVYEQPSDVAKPIDYIPNGEEVEILESNKRFYKVRFGRFKRIGYVSFNFCREVKASGT